MITIKTKKRLVYGIGAVVAIVMAICIITAIDIYYYGKTDEKQRADVAIVLGAAASDYGVSPVYRERINHAIWLYQNGYVKNIITTGGVTNGNTKSDAEIAKEYMVNNGIPESSVFTDNQSTITEENLKYAREIMQKQNFGSCILVSDPLHMKRSMQMAKDLGLTAFSSPTPTTRYQSLRTQIPFLARKVFFYLVYCVLSPFR